MRQPLRPLSKDDNRPSKVRRWPLRATAAAPFAPLSPTAAPTVAPAPAVAAAAPLAPYAAEISDDLLENVVTAFAEDIVPSHEHQQL